MRKLEFNQVYTAWRWQGWDRDTGSLEPESAAFLISPAPLHMRCGYQFLSLPELVNHLDSFENLLKAVFLHLKNSGFL